MSKPEHIEVANIRFNNGSHRFCLDKVIRHDRKGETEYSFVWRGNKVSPDGFVYAPAYFDWEILGQVIKKAYQEGAISEEDIKRFLIQLVNHS